ncbi:MAG TPA: hypothetical protein VIB48_15480, partial [Acidimicrobiia bacterium]
VLRRLVGHGQHPPAPLTPALVWMSVTLFVTDIHMKRSADEPDDMLGLLAQHPRRDMDDAPAGGVEEVATLAVRFQPLAAGVPPHVELDRDALARVAEVEAQAPAPALTSSWGTGAGETVIDQDAPEPDLPAALRPCAAARSSRVLEADVTGVPPMSVTSLAFTKVVRWTTTRGDLRSNSRPTAISTRRAARPTRCQRSGGAMGDRGAFTAPQARCHARLPTGEPGHRPVPPFVWI